MKRNPLLVLVVGLSALVALLYIGRLSFGSSVFYSHFMSDRAMVVIGGLTKLMALALSALFAMRSASLLGGGNPAQLPWRLLAGGLSGLSLGQATLVYYQIVRHISPFPSVADIWFVIAYPLLIAGVATFIAAYARSGFPTAGTATAFVILTIAAIVVAWPLLRPIVRSSDALLPKILNIAYPALDLLLLIPAIVLLRITVRFRGGEVWHIWLALLAGFVFTAVGDILFAYFSTLGFTQLDPAVHAVYIMAYAGLAAGAMVQRRLLTA